MRRYVASDRQASEGAEKVTYDETGYTLTNLGFVETMPDTMLAKAVSNEGCT
jgi:hypothetical protein